ncbi:hypothetical protein M9Y10_005350 [Tritrichomonas musculus]|uniref:Right handed beta helix domain-containing protein n=1 Tax=Tritrichomonas musculus TaxID=1915356 RepID=A0ABR2JKW0_9EUKA
MAFIRNKSDVGRRAIFIETDFECPSVASKPSVTPTIDISTCTFENNEGKNAGIVVGNSQNAPFSIKNCPFINCGNAGHVINVESNVQSTTIHDCSINYDSNTFSGGISIHSNGKIEISYISFISTSVDSALSIESEEETKLVSVMQCLFDSCTVNSQSCFYIYTQTSSFVFKDITVKNTKLTGCDNYLGRFILNGHYTLTITNVSFNNIACSSLFGGGIGMAFSGISELVFDKCYFVKNEAHQDRSESRPIAIKDADQTPYYNGDGGAIQIGCQTETAGMIVRFKNCNFNNNKAARHGGALAIQTIKEIELFECKIERNNENFDFESSSNLLYEKYFHKKKDRRGGAIYLNPAVGCVDSTIENVVINDCEISWNNAYDGYAMYVEGDDPGTSFTIIKNNFNENYNPKNYDNDPNIIYGAVITTEINTITKDSIRPPGNTENYNFFAYSNTNLKVNEISYVDHSGRTITKEFTASDYFPTEPFSLSLVFSNSFAFSLSNEFTDSNTFKPSETFSNSDYFLGSKPFSKTDILSKTGEFTYSEHFSCSYQFSKSKEFSDLNLFSNSDLFTKTKDFSKTDVFTKTDHFTESNSFSNSLVFTESNKFSSSDKFRIFFKDRLFFKVR